MNVIKTLRKCGVYNANTEKKQQNKDIGQEGQEKESKRIGSNSLFKGKNIKNLSRHIQRRFCNEINSKKTSDDQIYKQIEHKTSI